MGNRIQLGARQVDFGGSSQPSSTERLQDAMAHSLMNPTFPPHPGFPPQPEPRDIGKETRDTFQAMIDYAPRMYEMEARYGPKYALLDAQTMQDVLAGQGGMLDFYSREILPRSMQDASRMRESDIADIERYGGRATDAILDAYPQQRELLDEMNRQAQAELGRGGDLSPDQIRDVTQATRAAYSDRGMLRSGDAVMDEIANRHQYRDQREAQRRDFAGRVIGFNQAVTGDPMMSVLGRPSGASPQSGAMLGIGQQAAAGAGPSGMFDPMNQYAAGVHGGNQQMASSIYGNQAGLMGNIYGSQAGLMGSQFGSQAGLMGSMYGADRSFDLGLITANMQRDTARMQRDASIWGGLLGGAGAGLGAFFCWVAREVYGPHDPRWLKFRLWLHAYAPDWFYRFYARHGERIARWLQWKPRMKRLVRAWMDTKVREVRHAI